MTVTEIDVMNRKSLKLEVLGKERAAEAVAEPSAGDDLSCLLSSIQELNAAADLHAGLQRVTSCVAAAVPFDTLAILLVDKTGRDLRFEFAVGYDERVTRHWRFGMGQGLVGSVARSGEALRVDDVTADARYIDASPGTRAELAVPLTSKTGVIGVLDVGNATPGFFTAEHQHLLESLAGHLAGAIDNARLYQNLREQTRTLSLLHKLSHDLSSILDWRQLLTKVSELVHRLTDVDNFSVLLWNEERQRLLAVFSGSGEVSPEGESLEISLGEGLCGTAAALRRPVRVSNVHLDARYISCTPEMEVRSELDVPLVFKDRLIGVLVLESLEYDTFQESHEELLSTLASSIAIAFENSRLYEKLRQDEQRLAEDLNMAREIQRQLLPSSTPWVSGLQLAVQYCPARHLAGDFYDFLPFGEGRLAIAVGDVSGKATAAALYGAMAVGMLREYAASRHHDPARILQDLNDRLGELEVDRRFLAMTFGVYDSRDRSLLLAGSGLPHPLLVRDGVVEEIEVEGVPLGILGPQTYRQLRIDLQPGDVLVIYSDGVEDCQAPDEEEFGIERVREVLAVGGDSASEIAVLLMEATERHAAGAEAYDDRTILVLKAVATEA